MSCFLFCVCFLLTVVENGDDCRMIKKTSAYFQRKGTRVVERRDRVQMIAGNVKYRVSIKTST